MKKLPTFTYKQKIVEQFKGVLIFCSLPARVHLFIRVSLMNNITVDTFASL